MKRVSQRRRQQSLEGFLSEARQKKGMTLGEVASALGLKSGQSIWDWENGKGSGIPAEMLLRLASLYRFSVDEAYGYFVDFHQQRLLVKLDRKFQKAKAKVRAHRPTAT